MRWGMRTDNPCKGIERNREHHRRRYLSGDELARLIKALAAHPDKQAANIVRLLLLTGCTKRRSAEHALGRRRSWPKRRLVEAAVVHQAAGAPSGATVGARAAAVE